MVERLFQLLPYYCHRILIFYSFVIHFLAVSGTFNVIFSHFLSVVCWNPSVWKAICRDFSTGALGLWLLGYELEVPAGHGLSTVSMGAHGGCSCLQIAGAVDIDNKIVQKGVSKGASCLVRIYIFRLVWESGR